MGCGRLVVRRTAALLLAIACMQAQGQTLRWASRGEIQALDPYASTETVTLSLNLLLHDTLVAYGRDEQIAPGLAEAWQLVEPRRWRFQLRRGVKFHDGTPFSAADVAFTLERAQKPASRWAALALPLGQAVQIDEHTVELIQPQPNPLVLEQLAALPIMSRAWTLAQGAAEPPNLARNEDAPTLRNANGSGRYKLVRREPNGRTVLDRNTAWWGRFDGNVQRLEFVPIANDATRTAALLSGDVDLITEVPPQDLDRLAADRSVRVESVAENRVIFVAMDQQRDELLGSSLKGRNPFKDARVRAALAAAIDAAQLQHSIMRGTSTPTRCFAPSRAGCRVPALDQAAPPDPDRARRLLAQAGYPDGFDATLDCPNDRYVNDRARCAARWRRCWRGWA